MNGQLVNISEIVANDQRLIVNRYILNSLLKEPGFDVESL